MHTTPRYAMLACAVMSWLTMPVLAEAAENGSPEGDANSRYVTTRDVNVEANRAKEEAKYESQSTTIITKEDIEKKQAKNLEDIIFSETGVTRTVDAMGRVGIAIRGADPRHTLMLIDGQPVMGSESKYMGGSDEAMRIGAENIERVEIIRGAATAKYGPDAIGGVVNIITKAPANTPTFEFNAEARYHKHDGTDENKNTWPSNFYMRADSGKVGNAKFSIFGSKRDIMPVYSSERGYKKGESWYFEDFKPSLRYYGDIKTIGASGEVDLNENNKISFRVMQEREDMQRRNKSATDAFSSLFEPMQIFDRDMERSTYNFSYTGKNDKHDWKIDVNYGKMKENDVTKTTYYGSGHDQYGGKNTLATVDWLEHKQLDLNATMNTQVNDKHLLTYGIGYTDERADGTRLRNAPKKWTKSINPWDYDKSLWVPNGKTEPDSNIHDYVFKQTGNGLIWDKSAEYYGSESAPPFTAEDADKIKSVPYLSQFIQAYGSAAIGMDLTSMGIAWSGDADLQKRFEEFNTILKTENTNLPSSTPDLYKRLPVLGYYGIIEKNPSGFYGQDKNITWNGKYYGEDFEKRNNRVSGGEARIQRRHAFIGDTWQVNDDTILTPVLRIDNSDLFGSHVTTNLGMTHNIKGNAHRRLKINAGTGYAEPGMGELYYNWEMYGSSGGDRYGWYWLGNPNLKPEKSVNFDISIEGESNKTYAKASVFHNTINDYMTSYFLGQLIDFNQLGSAYVTNADRIYSFKNIGKAEITGFEAEIQQRFNDKWSAKLGYAWLHAINKSDPDMPRTLLDRPQHKIDISFTYDDQKSGWKAALWADYYIHMLDSNSVTTVFTSADIDANGNWKKKDANYQKKTFGIWNFMLEKQVSPDAKVYFGIDNLFNHRDDDRAYMDRTYRIGANIKFGYHAKQAAKTAKEAEKEAAKTALHPADRASDYDAVTTQDGTQGIVNNADWFLPKPSDKDAGRKKGDVDLIGDYRVRSNMYGGKDLAAPTLTTTAELDAGATKNMQQAPDHGLEQRLSLGIDAQLGDTTNLVVEGSTGDTIDTKYSKADKRGLHDVRLERAELNQKANRWDFTIGRLTEKMGVTGYWFGKEYDGVRATWTGDRTQVRIGYGDFSKSTGITDSAYTHSEKAIIMRSPTLEELFGYNFDHSGNGDQPVKYPAEMGEEAWQTNGINYYAKFNHVGQIQQADGTWVKDLTKSDLDIANEKLHILQELNTQLLKVAEQYPSDGNAGNGNYGGEWYKTAFMTGTDPEYLYKWNEMDSKIMHTWTGTNPYSKKSGSRYRSEYNQQIGVPVKNANGSVQNQTIYVNALRTSYGLADKSWGEMLDITNGKRNIYEYLSSVYDAVQQSYAGKGSTPFVDRDGNTLSKEDALNQMFVNFVGTTAYPKDSNKDEVLSNFMELARLNFRPLNEADTPISSLDKIIKVQGTLLKQDIIPAIDRAAFIQVRQKISSDLGLTAWYLRSSGDQFHKTGYNEDMSTYQQSMDVANVFGLGAQYRLGASRLSFDWGVNYSETGRYFNGGRDAYGRYTGGGSNPTFWVLRADIGHADTDVQGSWNAFADYKYFQHGAFFGGNGTEALPDRYLDGIRSFTLGAGYVPAKNFLLEAFYTFGAKSTGQRDTLHGAEHFTLGDYTRLQVSYKF